MLILVAAFAVLSFLGYFNSPYRQAEQYARELEEAYANDTYGGETPEETLELFISALEAGDIELASKYFVLDKQEEWLNNLQEIENKDLIGDMITDLEREKDIKELGDGRVVFYIYNDNDQLALAIDIGRGPNGVWKIVDM